MSERILLAIFILLPSLIGCATEASRETRTNQPTYLEQVASLPEPQDENQRQRMCGQLRAEIARMQNAATYFRADPNLGTYAQMASRRNIAALEAKAAEFRCSAAFAERNAPTGINACIAACRANTSRSPDQCFDACNR
jgi:hypothetical protein